MVVSSVFSRAWNRPWLHYTRSNYERLSYPVLQGRTYGMGYRILGRKKLLACEAETLNCP